jgi:hypothetical protein
VKLTEYRIIVNSRSDTVRIKPLGDIHLGVRNSDEELLQEEIDDINNDPNCYWIGMGDYVEAIKPRIDRRMDFRTLADWIETKDLADIVRVQSHRFLDYVYPIRHKCIGLLVGNHEQKVELRDDQGIVDHMAVELGTKNLSYQCMVRLLIERKIKSKKNPSKEILIYANHGSGGGRYVGGKINKIIGAATSWEANVYLMGHVHEKLVHEIPKMHLFGRGENLRLLEVKQFFILTGTFLRSYMNNSNSYAESKMYNPTSLGTVTINISAFRQKKYEHDESPIELPPKIWISQ